MFQTLRTLASNQRLLKELIVRDLKARYVGSSMGFFWSVIFPIINLVVYSFVFNILLGSRFDDSAGIKDVAIWMLVGIVVWNAFSETLTRSTNCLVDNANLIQKVVFPAGVLPAYLTTSSLVNMAIGFPVVLAGVLYFGYINPTQLNQQASEIEEVVSQELVAIPAEMLVLDGNGLPPGARTAACNYCGYEEHLICPNDGTAMRVLLPEIEGAAPVKSSFRGVRLGGMVLFLPILMLLQGIFTTGLGMFLAAFNLILRDTAHLIGVFVMVWMFSTPIFYPPTIFTAAKHEGRFDLILELNPMFWLIDCYREVLLYNSLPSGVFLGKFAVVAVVVFYLGSTFFSRQRDRFPDLL